MKIIVKEEKNLIDYLVSNTDYTKTKIKRLLKKKIILKKKEFLMLL